MKRFIDFAKTKLKAKDKKWGLLVLSGLLCGTVLIPKILNAAGVTINHGPKYSVLMKGERDKAFITTVKKFQDGVFGYCLNEPISAPPTGTTIYPTGTYTNDKVYRVIKYGYPHKKWFSGSSERAEQLNYYITQLAVWHYTDNYSVDYVMNSPAAWGKSKLPNLTEEEITKVKNGFKELVDKAESVKDKEAPHISASKYETGLYPWDNNQYLASDYITVNGTNISGKITVKLEGAPAGAQVMDKTNNPRTTFNPGEQFYIRIPYQFGSGSFKYSLSSNSQSVRGVVYEGGPEYQDIVRYETVDVKLNDSKKGTIAWNVTPGKLEITKVNDQGEPLRGAVFTVSSDDASYDKDHTTNSEGKIVLDKLSEGTYNVVEKQAPEGYVIDRTPKTIRVTAGNTAKLRIVNSKSVGKLTIKKIDEHTSAPVEGARFRVWSSETGYDSEFTTNSEGLINVERLPVGDYDVQEVEAPPGYEKYAHIKPANILNNGYHKTVEFTNHPYDGVIKVVKKGAQSVNLEGAVFRLTGPAGYSQDKRTGPNGEAEWTKLAPGDYTLEEIQPPPGYDKTNETWSFRISAGAHEHSYTQEVFNTQTKASVSLLKVDSETNEPLSGAKFRITGPEGFNKELSSNGAGLVVLSDIVFGEYTVQEIQAPEGYVLSEEQHRININEAGETYKIEIPNRKIKGNLEILKVDGKDQKPLEGAQFRITGPHGYDKTQTTNSSGKITLSSLPYGTYTVTEVKAPQGYEINSSPQTVKVSENGHTYKITHENTKQKGGVKVIKTSDDGTPLQGVTFELKSKEDPSVVFNKETDVSGHATFTNVPFGTYTLKETATLDTHILNTEVKNVNVESVEQVYEFEYVNERKKGSIEVIKVDKETKSRLEGAQFRVQSDNGYSEVVTTNREGVGTLNGVPLGTYTILEITPPKGYTLNPERFVVKVAEHGQKYSTTVENVKAEGGVTVTKTNNKGNRLTGATFELRSEDGSYTKSLTTDSTGVVTFEKVPLGKYTVTETQAPVGYLLNEEPQEVNVEDAGRVYEVTHVNEKIEGSIEITKTCKTTGKTLEGAQFSVTGPGDYNETITTGPNGKGLLENVPYGEYTVTEIKAPDGYILDDTPHTINITEHGRKYDLALQNNKSIGAVQVTKRDEKGELLAGAEFELKPKQGGEAKTAVTNQAGIATFQNVTFGEYTLKETRAPEGYLLDTTVKEVIVNESEKTYTFDFVNVKKKGQIEIVKVDAETREPLEGVEFEILNAKEEVVDTLVTNETGTVKSKLLEVGTYKVRETKTKPNYVLNTKEVSVTLYEHEQVLTEEIENHKAKGTLELTKKDVANGLPLPNAKFKIYAENGETVVTEGTTDEEGVARFTLEMGKYFYQEYDAPDNYLIDESLFPFEIKSNGDIVKAEMTNIREAIDVKIHKTGTDFNVGLEGAVFQIHKNGEPMSFNVEGRVVTNFTTDKKGNIDLPAKLDVGNYELVEVKAPAGYNLAEPKAFEITAELVGDGSQSTTIEVADKEIKGNVKLIKVESETNRLLKGVKFELIRLTDLFGKEVNEKVGEYVTDDDGVIVVNDLLYGKYQFREIEASEGYIIDETPIDFVIQEEGHTVEVGMDNKIIKGDVQLIKSDSEDQRRLPDVRFNLYQISESLEGVQLPTPGEEEQPTEEPTEQPTEQPAEEGAVKKIVNKVKDLFTDMVEIQPGQTEEKPEEVEEEKPYDPENDPYKDLGTYIGTYTTDEAGLINVEDLRYGHYVLVETKPAVGYIGEGDTVEFVIQENEHTVPVTMTNDKIKGTLELTKTDVANGDLLPNAGFRIYGADGETVVVEGRTNEEGKAIFELNYGEYYYQEFDAPEGYIIDESLFPFEIKENGEIIKAEMKNKMIEGTLELNKTDIATGQLLPNAKFEIYDETGENVVAKGMTDEKGLAQFKLNYGKYFYREYEAPNGYLVDDSLFPFEIKEDGEIVKAEMTNVMKEGKVLIRKIDSETGDTLVGAVFELYDKNDELLLTGSTDTKGELAISDLPLGDYYIKEKIAPGGYELNEDKIKFTIEEHEQLVELTVKNKPITPIELPKTGTNLLKIGAPLALITLTGAVVYGRRRK